MRKELVFVLLALFLCAGCNGNKKKMNGEHDLDAANITLDDHTISFYYNWYGNPSVDGEMKHWMHPIALAPGHSGDVGAISGLLVDIFWGQLLGFHTLLYTVIGYLNGSFERLFYDEDVKLPIVLISASEFLYGICIYVFVYMLQGDFAFGTYLFSIIIPELVYTILVTLILYQVILHINRKLESEEQRSASKFV